MKKLRTTITAFLAVALCTMAIGFATAFAVESSSNTSNQLSTQSLTATQLTTQSASDSWGLESIYAREAQEYLKTKSNLNNVCVAVIDTGFYTEHPVFKDKAGNSKIIQEWNVLPDGDSTGTINNAPQIDSSTNTIPELEFFLEKARSSSVLPPSNTGDSSFDSDHGTHVAGIIRDVAPDANLIVIRASNSEGRITPEALYNAFCLIRYYKSRYSADIRVINLSGGTPSTSMFGQDDILSQIDNALGDGIVTVCSAGNTGTTGYNYPADYAPVVNVMALARVGKDSFNVVRDSQSNYNAQGETTKDISAPGSRISSSTGTSGYGEKSGTSMAAPHVAGVLALMFEAGSYSSDKTGAEAAINKLYTSTTWLNNANWSDEYGHGEVNALLAVDGQAIKGPSEIPMLLGNNPYAATYSVIGSNDGWTWSIGDENNPNITSNTAFMNNNYPGKVFGGKTAGTVTVWAQRDGLSPLKKTINIDRLDFSLIGTTGYPVAWGDVDFSNEIKGATYTGSYLTPKLGIKINGYQLTEGTDYDVVFNNNLNASTANKKAGFTIKGKGTSCKGEQKGTFTISPAKLVSSDVSLSSTSVQYTGSAYMPAVTVMHGGRTLVVNRDYVVEYKDNVAPGIAKVVVTGKGNYTGTAKTSFAILSSSSQASKKANTLSASPLVKKVKYKKVKKKTQKVACPVSVSKAQGTVTYKLVNVNKKAGKKKIKIDTNTGKITAKKGLKKGTYKLTIQVTASGTGSYRPATQTVVAQLRVK